MKQNLKKMYESNVNIMEFFRNQTNLDKNDINAILYSYDLQSGSYTDLYDREEKIDHLYMINNEMASINHSEFKQIYGIYFEKILKRYEFQSILEVGVGEGTTICDTMDSFPDKEVYGIDLSLSRILYARKFAQRKQVDINLSVGDMFELPFLDSSIDIVFTCHCIEPNTGREKDALLELYRVAKQYVILVEPSYDLGNEETKKRIEEHCYIKGLPQAIKELDYDMVEHRLFEVTTYPNNSAITIIKKEHVSGNHENELYACPVCKNKLHRYPNEYYCSECFLIYPVINHIPILNRNNSILCSKYKTFNT